MPDEPVSFEHFQVARRDDGSLFELSRGALGVTCKVYDTCLDGFVALKVIHPGYPHDDNDRERFLREARAAAHLDHPNVAAVFHRGREGGTYFYAMQFIEGETLDAYVRRRGPLPVTVENCEFTGNRSHHNARTGINFAEGTRGTAERNTSENNTEFGSRSSTPTPRRR